jgi:hypothetical protein
MAFLSSRPCRLPAQWPARRPVGDPTIGWWTCAHHPMCPLNGPGGPTCPGSPPKAEADVSMPQSSSTCRRPSNRRLRLTGEVPPQPAPPLRLPRARVGEFVWLQGRARALVGFDCSLVVSGSDHLTWVGDDVVAAATIDRLVHHAHVIPLDGDSYRTRAHRTKTPPPAVSCRLQRSPPTMPPSWAVRFAQENPGHRWHSPSGADDGACRRDNQRCRLVPEVSPISSSHPHPAADADHGAARQ